MSSEAAEHLFEWGHHSARRSAALAGGHGLDGLSLDRKPSLVAGSDAGLPARRVCLHSRDKAHFARYYADIVGRAMQTAYPGPLVWIELFAGPGELYVEDLGKFMPGSPVEAVTIPVPFNKYVFVDLDPKCVEALKVRVGEDGDRVHCLQGSANSPDIHDAIVQLVPKNALVVLYADPEGLDLDFDTIKFFARRYKHLDLLLNLPIPGIDRALSAKQEAKASRVLNHPAPVELIGPASVRSRQSLREWFTSQLTGLGYTEFDSTVIRYGQTKSPLYDLMIASRAPQAIKFFGEAKKRGPGGQYTLDLDV